MLRVIFLLLLVLITASGAPRHAAAQTVPPHPAAPAAAPAKPPVSAIIPGSPLAAITGVGATPQKGPDKAYSPFGTKTLGMSITSVISREASGTVGELLTAIHKSTALTPVWQWLGSFPADQQRQENALDIARGLALTVFPALILEALIRLALVRPRALLGRRAPPPENDAPELSASEDASAAGDPVARPLKREAIVIWFRRLGLGLLHLLLCLLPIVVFVLVAGSLLGLGFITSPVARLSVIGVSNAYLLCRFALEVLRFFITPWTPRLRLVPLSDRQALSLNRGVRILLATGAGTYILVSISEILGLPHTGGMAVTRLLVLAVHVELAIMIWRSRKLVGSWIRGKPDADTLTARARRRIGGSWHYFALFYVLALWVAWAGGIPHAFVLLLRVVLFFIAAVVLGRLAWSGSEHLLDRIFPDPKERKLRHPNLVNRARAYNPLIKIVIRIIIILAMIAVILLGWGVDILPWLLKDPLSRGLISAFFTTIVTIAIALILWEIANGVLEGRIDRLTAAGRTRHALRLRTLAPILKATFGTVIGLLAGLICLSKIGVNAAPLLAGAGVLGIAIGFGSQKLVQDLITGLFLLMEDTMQVGDVVTLAGMSGTVERLSIRTIRLRGGDGSVNIIPFSSVTTVTNQTRDFGSAQISVGVSYDENIDHVFAVLTDIARTMRSEPTWATMMRDDLQINGLDELGSNAMIITGQIRTGPGQHWSVRREFMRRVVQRFAEEGIQIPYNSSTSTLMVDPKEFDGLLQRLGPAKEETDSEEKQAKRPS